MPVTDIKEIRILPPLAIARFGSSSEPMHNYRIELNDTFGFRDTVPAETLALDPTSGEIVAAVVPNDVRFKDSSGKIKPIAPFLEVWALFDDEDVLRPLTTTELDELKIPVSNLSWSITVGNRKIYRRTGDLGDSIDASETNISDHSRREIRGTAGNFKPNQAIPLGWFQFVCPNAKFPEIRARYTPSDGSVFGPADDGVVSGANAVYDATTGNWDGHDDDNDLSRPPLARFMTQPQSIFARNPSTGSGLGYFDNSCDGVVALTLHKPNGSSIECHAWIASGPPDFAPDSLPVRSMADDLEQMAFGPTISPGDPVSAEEVRDIVRRALETLQLMSAENENANFGNPFATEEVEYVRGRGIHLGFLTSLEGLDSPTDSPERRVAYDALLAVRRVIRTYREAPDISGAGTRKMPALMRGADGMRLALTRRQVAKLDRAIKIFAPVQGDAGAIAAMTRMIASFAAMAVLHSSFTLNDGTRLSEVFADPDAVLEFLLAGAAQGDVADKMGVTGQPLVVPGDPDNSVFVALIENEGHPMNGPIGGYTDSQTGEAGVEIVRNWILSFAVA